MTLKWYRETLPISTRDGKDKYVSSLDRSSTHGKGRVSNGRRDVGVRIWS